jgi:hypothetical protein
LIKNLITDYKVVIICVTDKEVKELIEQQGRVIMQDDTEWDAKALAKRVALVKGINAYKLRKIFTFHGRVEGAKAFTSTDSPYGLNKIFDLLNSSLRGSAATEAISLLNHPSDNRYFHVNGTMSSGIRNSLLKEFKDSPIGIISNARCLTEGVDIPAVDCVAFIDPKRSLIDIVQATGRALRKADWKEKGYIFIPVIVAENTDPEEMIQSSDFKTVWQVLQAMTDQDQRLQDLISHLRTLQGKGEENTPAWKTAMQEYKEKIEFFNLPTKISQSQFTEKLYTKTIEMIAKSWDFWYGLTLKYKEQFGDANAPLDYKTPNGFKLGSWQSVQRRNFKKSKLDSQRIQRLEEIGFVWNPFNQLFEQGFQATLEYKKQFGDTNAPQDYKTPDGFKLGIWQSNLRNKFINNKLDPQRIRRLEEIGFVWNPQDLEIKELFEKGFRETLEYKKQYGNANAELRYRTQGGFKLGRWQGTQRGNFKNNKLDSEKIQRLKEIGFVWNPKELEIKELFEQGFQETLQYKKQFGNANAPNKHKTSGGFKLGRWQGTQRGNFKNNKLDSKKIHRLEEIGFVWDILDQAFEQGFQETLQYKNQYGDANATIDYKTPNGFKLGSWQSERRKSFKRNKLSPERIHRLEKIGFVWNPFDQLFEQGFQATLEYKKKYGDTNAPREYTTPAGFKLGIWQKEQRAKIKKNKLDTERIQRLKKIGFVWNPLDQSFEKWYQETLKYKKQYGNTNVPQDYKTPNGFNLGNWLSHQKRNFKNNKLAPERIQRLRKIGFVWLSIKKKKIK